MEMPEQYIGFPTPYLENTTSDPAPTAKPFLFSKNVMPETTSSPLYADVLVPLALPGTYTYAVPDAMAGDVSTGCRVVVPFGPRRFYTAVVVRLHTTKPEPGVALKSIADTMGRKPLLLPVQIDFWNWLASYYLCTPGEVMRAALPGGLKPESETLLTADEDFADTDGLAPRERQVLDALSHDKAVSVEQLGRQLGMAGLLPAVRRLVERGAVRVHESLSRAFRPRTETRVRLTPAWMNGERLDAELLALGARSPRQAALLHTLIELSGTKAALKLGNENLTGEVAQRTLLRQVPGAASALTALRRKGIVETYVAEVGRIRSPKAVPELSSRPLSHAQQEAFDAIRSNFERHAVCLLHGVTSSGKTEIYIRLIEHELAAGRQVLYLLPEIALTTQITTRLGRVFGERMGIYHSRFPDAERVEIWQRQLGDRPFALILGVRSSVFLPFQNLGLVIVDEEHETSYKQQEPAPRYNARDAAMVLARRCGAKTLLGTATPSLETYRNAAVTGKYGYVSLTRRYGDVLLPEIVVEDVKELRRKKLMKTLFSPRLTDEIRRALDCGEQVILFQNRRGYSPVLECRTCGWTPRCTACDVTLTFHQKAGKLFCHYCGAAYDLPRACPNCEDTELRDIGYGTEKVEAAVHASFPSARTARMDLDTTRTRTAYEKIIRDFQQGDTDILIGTQMVTKGLDFERVRVVGILNADQMLGQPDFRAYERAFQMMAQVAGRAGRRGRRGIVVLQTRQAELPIIAQVVANDYEAMFRSQLVEREMFLFPPACRLIDIYLRHRDEHVCSAAAEVLAAMLRPHFGDSLLGPDRPVVGRIQRQYIRKLMLKPAASLPPAGVRRTLLAARTALVSQADYKAVSVYFDVDPL